MIYNYSLMTLNTIHMPAMSKFISLAQYTPEISVLSVLQTVASLLECLHSHSEPFNSMGLNCVSLLICGFFLFVFSLNTYCSATQSKIGWICRCGIMYFKISYKVILGFLTDWSVGVPNFCVIQGSTVYPKLCWYLPTPSCFPWKPSPSQFVAIFLLHRPEILGSSLTALFFHTQSQT